MQGCESCENLFDGYEPLGFHSGINEADIKSKLGDVYGLYLIEVKDNRNTIDRDKTFIQAALNGKIPDWMMDRIIERDVEPLRTVDNETRCKIVYIGKAEEKTLYERFTDLFIKAHTNRNSLWIMLEYGWVLEYWYQEMQGQSIKDAERDLIEKYAINHGSKPVLNRR